MSLQDFDIQTLAPGDKWPVSPGGTVTYSFVTAASASSYPADADETNIGEVTEGIKNNVRQILNNLFSSVIPIKFQEVPDTTSSHGQIRILFSDGPGKGDSSSAYAYFPGTKPNSGAVHLRRDYENDSENNAYSNPPGSFGYYTLIHELGHAMGLNHPGAYNGNEVGAGATDGGPYLSFDQDNTLNTVMSYNQGEPGPYPSTLMAYDIRALQSIYGVPDPTNGDTVYTFDSNSIKQTKTIWDSSGNNTISLTGVPADDSYYLDLKPGGLIASKNAVNSATYKHLADPSKKDFSITQNATVIGPNTLIKNAIGSLGSDEIYGNTADNNIQGLAGDDTIEGGSGNDTLMGEAGDDLLRGGEGNDLLMAGKGTNILYGDRGNDTLIGGKGEDKLTGGAGADWFILESGPGSDIITDFTQGEDILGLSGGLSFSDLSITEGTGPNDNQAIIRVGPEGDVLARLQGVQAQSLTAANFRPF
ncbi:MAG: matrixin family metalloprotease [Actinomycetota bacterium]